jgi:hypothetical protein
MKEDIARSATSTVKEADDLRNVATVTDTKSSVSMIDDTAAGPNGDMRVRGTCKSQGVSVREFTTC